MFSQLSLCPVTYRRFRLAHASPEATDTLTCGLRAKVRSQHIMRSRSTWATFSLPFVDDIDRGKKLVAVDDGAYERYRKANGVDMADLLCCCKIAEEGSYVGCCRDIRNDAER
uniref:IlGF domain-containing protein n=1 Tax=Panagrellus redivivus TaxID=6233 RepID=A0A7E4ZZJ4_PANRE